jgi:hypothetical protein
MTMIKGISVNLGGTDYIVPPLTLNAIEQFQDQLAEYKGGIDSTSTKLVKEVVLASLKRNYPDMTLEKLGDIIDMGNISIVFNAVMGVSRLQEKGENVGMGEATAP